MQDFVFNTIPSIRQMHGGAAQLGGVVGGMGFARPGARVMFITDAGITRLDLAGPGLADLRAQGFEVVLFDGVEPDRVYRRAKSSEGKL